MAASVRAPRPAPAFTLHPALIDRLTAGQWTWTDDDLLDIDDIADEIAAAILAADQENQL